MTLVGKTGYFYKYYFFVIMSDQFVTNPHIKDVKLTTVKLFYLSTKRQNVWMVLLMTSCLSDLKGICGCITSLSVSELISNVNEFMIINSCAPLSFNPCVVFGSAGSVF